MFPLDGATTIGVYSAAGTEASVVMRICTSSLTAGAYRPRSKSERLIDLAEVRDRVGVAEVVPLRDHVGVRRIHGVGDRRGEGGGAGDGQGGAAAPPLPSHLEAHP